MNITETCEGCGAPSPHGLSLDITGGYNEFTDNYDGERHTKSLRLCHDCVLRLVSLFPALRDKFGRGCHPCDDAFLPCCAHAWTQIDGVPHVASPMLDGWVPL